MAAAVTGWVVWRRWHLRHTEARQASRARRALPELIELLAIAISAGQTPTQAIDELSTTAPPLLQPALVSINHRLHHGHRFVDAIQVLREQFGLDAAGMVDLMVAADRDGLPAEPVLTQLAADARQQRRRDAEADARRLPVRLAAPLVLCTLPGFVLLAVVPLVAGALSSLSLP
jgi:tight adherence protein C